MIPYFRPKQLTKHTLWRGIYQQQQQQQQHKLYLQDFNCVVTVLQKL